MKCISYIDEDEVAFRVYNAEDRVPKAVFVRFIGADGEMQVEKLAKAEERFSVRLQGLEEGLGEKHRAKFAPYRRIDYSIKLPDYHVKSIKLFNDGEGGQSREIGWMTTDLALTEMLPSTKVEFREFFSFASNRHRDAQTSQFVARSILRYYQAKENVDPELFGYIVNAVVILIYKSIEAGNTVDDLEDLWTFANTTLAKMPEDRSSVREEPLQLKISYLTALWHYRISQGDVDKALETAETATEIYFSSGVNFRLTYGYNLCKCMLFCAIVYYARDNRKSAAKYARLTVDCFVKAVNCRTVNSIWFNELEVSHRSASAATRILESVTKEKPMTDADLARELSVALRVSESTFVAKARTLLFKNYKNKEEVSAIAG
ncbi:hypothetical protein LGR54_07020 [Ancylobacter sp. Lp-2]|uniref:hypothetical protein n=1 Tax=Ancylobacter sp. Lp-2 TaxID=2881339 RepID=UPI001E326849|nr:hypothetical protein [Ancylobacter sp. Lp-2]MCB4768350.1 hypothetical protein [Ancylobacter sp. Lp-2]